MSGLKSYEYTAPNGVRTVLRLTERDAKARGLTEAAPPAPARKRRKQAVRPRNKAVAPEGNKEATVVAETTAEPAATED